MLQSCNLGSIIVLETDEKDRSLYFFMSLTVFIKGWRHCRPVIIVYGIFMKVNYHGTFLSACAVNANQKIFPLAFGVGDQENNASWEFFFAKLKEAIRDKDDLTIILDRHEGIKNTIKKVYLNVEHGHCMQHLVHNVKTHFRHTSKVVHQKFVKATEAYNVQEWEKS